jgi:hypothetical protein
MLRATGAAIAAPLAIVAIAAVLLSGGLGGLGSLGQVATGPEPSGAGGNVRPLRPAPAAHPPIVLAPAGAASRVAARGGDTRPRGRAPAARLGRGPETPASPGVPAPPVAPAPPAAPAPADGVVAQAEHTARAVSGWLPAPVGAITNDLLDAAIGPEPSAPSRNPLPSSSH